ARIQGLRTSFRDAAIPSPARAADRRSGVRIPPTAQGGLGRGEAYSTSGRGADRAKRRKLRARGEGRVLDSAQNREKLPVGPGFRGGTRGAGHRSVIARRGSRRARLR